MSRSFLMLIIAISVHTASVANIQIATGSKAGRYYSEGLKFCEKAKERCNVLETHGSLENIELLRSGKVSYAIVQGNVLKGMEDEVEIVSQLYTEYLIFFAPRNSQIDILNPDKPLVLHSKSGAYSILRDINSQFSFVDISDDKYYESVNLYYKVVVMEYSSELRLKSMNYNLEPYSIPIPDIEKALTNANSEYYSSSRVSESLYGKPFNTIGIKVFLVQKKQAKFRK